MENIMMEIMYDVPSRDDVEKVVITKETVKNNVPPTVILQKPDSKNKKKVKEETAS
jgi:ATP-dependent Clp protease ATP-binding subunit ClpX